MTDKAEDNVSHGEAVQVAGKGKKSKLNPYGAIVAKKDRAAKMVVQVFEPEGGAPYIVEVQPKKGNFTLPNSEQMFKITRGSVWIEAGVARTCVNTGNPQTVNIHTLTGTDVFNPVSYNADMNNNLAEQVARIAKTKPIWARSTTWGLLGSAVVLGLLMFWLIKTVGSGLEDIQTALEGVKIAAQTNSGSGPVLTPTEGGHNVIAPGGA